MQQLRLFQQHYRHLELRRLDLDEKVYKPIPPAKTPLNHTNHGLDLKVAFEHAIEAIERQPRPAGVDPARILRVELNHPVDAEFWRRAGLTILREESRKALVLFSSDAEMATFKEQIAEYHAGQVSRSNQIRPDHHWVEAIVPSGVGPLTAADRCGRLLAYNRSQSTFDVAKVHRLDVELWNLGKPAACLYALGQVEDELRNCGGWITDRQEPIDPLDPFQLRIAIPGAAIAELLTIPWIAQVELPPSGGYSLAEVEATTEGNFRRFSSPRADAPRLGILDSGIVRDHPALRHAVGLAIAVPPALGATSKRHPHGTAVAGVAVYGNVDNCRQLGTFDASLWLDSAQVTNARNEFDSDMLIASQMREAITQLVARGCRVINLSLGDPRFPYDGKKPSAWAETLDNLAHELNVVLVVSAGNYYHQHEQGVIPSDLLRRYPHYLLDGPASIIEPATAANALTVGALAAPGKPARAQRRQGDVLIDPLTIAKPDEPSPFTRSGFGVDGSVKPDLVEYGGNWSYDPERDCVRKDSGLGIVTLNPDFVNGGLLAIDHGTSLAAPRVAHMAARVLEMYPDASANLVRALLAHGAEIPAAVERLPVSDEDRLRLCGYGRPNPERVLYSTDNRAVLMAEEMIDIDHLHIYEIPVPTLLRDTSGWRRVTVTLAFDPPVRRNADYLGNTMFFRLMRGQTLEQVIKVFRAPDKGQQKSAQLPKHTCPVLPGATHRDAGTLQHANWTFCRRNALAYDEPLYLVVNSKRGWQPQGAQQRYAVVVSLEHQREHLPLYSAVQQCNLLAQQNMLRAS